MLDQIVPLKGMSKIYFDYTFVEASVIALKQIDELCLIKY